MKVLNVPFHVRAARLWHRSRNKGTAYESDLANFLKYESSFEEQLAALLGTLRGSVSVEVLTPD